MGIKGDAPLLAAGGTVSSRESVRDQPAPGPAVLPPVSLLTINLDLLSPQEGLAFTATLGPHTRDLGLTVPEPSSSISVGL